MRWSFLILLAACTNSSSKPAEPQAEPLVELEREMTPPSFDFDAMYATIPQEIRAGQRAGMLAVKCEVLSTGVMRNCKENKALDGIGPHVIERMEKTIAQPATKNGKPVSTTYVFIIRIK